MVIHLGSPTRIEAEFKPCSLELRMAARREFKGQMNMGNRTESL